MPKTPVTYRETFYSEIRGSGNPPLLKHLEWNRIETELGTCVEPRAPLTAPGNGNITQVDLTDFAANKISIIDEDTFQNQFGTGGPQAPLDYNA